MSNLPPDAGWMGDRRRGAGHGRPSTEADPDYEGRLFLTREVINSGGYDGAGAYWGLGAPLYYGRSYDEPLSNGDYPEAWVRANTRDEAKALIRERYPKAKFFR